MAKTVAVTVCLGLILALAMVADVHADCNIAAMAPCLNAAKSGAQPTGGCCNAVASMGQGADGPRCLCSLATSATAQQNQVNLDYAMAIPQKCGFPVPKGSTCNNKLVPGA